MPNLEDYQDLPSQPTHDLHEYIRVYGRDINQWVTFKDNISCHHDFTGRRPRDFEDQHYPYTLGRKCKIIDSSLLIENTYYRNRKYHRGGLVHGNSRNQINNRNTDNSCFNDYSNPQPHPNGNLTSWGYGVGGGFCMDYFDYPDLWRKDVQNGGNNQWGLGVIPAFSETYSNLEGYTQPQFENYCVGQGGEIPDSLDSNGLSDCYDKSVGVGCTGGGMCVNIPSHTCRAVFQKLVMQAYSGNASWGYDSAGFMCDPSPTDTSEFGSQAYIISSLCPEFCSWLANDVPNVEYSYDNCLERNLLDPIDVNGQLITNSTPEENLPCDCTGYRYLYDGSCLFPGETIDENNDTPLQSLPKPPIKPPGSKDILEPYPYDSIGEGPGQDPGDNIGIECIEDEDCPEGSICRDNQCVGVLIPPGSDDNTSIFECVYDRDCEDGQICYRNFCREEISPIDPDIPGVPFDYDFEHCFCNGICDCTSSILLDDDPPSMAEYNCIQDFVGNHSCFQVAPGNGAYRTLLECERDCGNELLPQSCEELGFEYTCPDETCVNSIEECYPNNIWDYWNWSIMDADELGNSACTTADLTELNNFISLLASEPLPPECEVSVGQFGNTWWEIISEQHCPPVLDCDDCGCQWVDDDSDGFDDSSYTAGVNSVTPLVDTDGDGYDDTSYTAGFTAGEDSVTPLVDTDGDGYDDTSYTAGFTAGEDSVTPLVDTDGDGYDDTSYTAGVNSVTPLVDSDGDGYDDTSYTAGVNSVTPLVDTDGDGYDDTSYTAGFNVGVDSVTPLVDTDGDGHDDSSYTAGFTAGAGSVTPLVDNDGDGYDDSSYTNGFNAGVNSVWTDIDNDNYDDASFDAGVASVTPLVDIDGDGYDDSSYTAGFTAGAGSVTPLVDSDGDGYDDSSYTNGFNAGAASITPLVDSDGDGYDDTSYTNGFNAGVASVTPLVDSDGDGYDDTSYTAGANSVTPLVDSDGDGYDDTSYTNGFNAGVDSVWTDIDNDNYDDASFNAGVASVTPLVDSDGDGYDDTSYTAGVNSVTPLVDSDGDGYDDTSYTNGFNAGVNSVTPLVDTDGDGYDDASYTAGFDVGVASVTPLVDTDGDGYDDTSYTIGFNAGVDSVTPLVDSDGDGYDDTSYTAGVNSVTALIDTDGDTYDDTSYTAGQQSVTVKLMGYAKPGGSVNPSESGFFDFHYPYTESISIKEIFNHIWLEDPDAYCQSNGYNSWETCVVDGSDGNEVLNTLPPVDSDLIFTRMESGHLKSATAIPSSNTWSTFTDSYGSETSFGNASDSECDEMDGTCITKGFMGTIGLQLYDGSDMQFLGCVEDECNGSCGSGIFWEPYGDGSGRKCECGLRDTLRDCNRPYGYLKFKPPIENWGTV